MVSISLPNTTETHCSCTKAYFRRTPSGYIRILFLKNSMDPDFIGKHFDGGFFRVEQPVELPEYLVDNYGLKEDKIYTGQYRVREFPRVLSVDFEPSEKNNQKGRRLQN